MKPVCFYLHLHYYLYQKQVSYRSGIRMLNDKTINSQTVYTALIIHLFLLVIVESGMSQQLTNIGYGWAQNSVNTVIFRKNSVVYYKGDQYAAYYDSTGTIVLAKRKYGDTTWILNRTQYAGNIYDAHCSISIMIDGNGLLHMAWGQHDNPLNYCTGSFPGSIIMNNKSVMTGIQEDSVSYPEFYKLSNGDLLFFYRQGRSGKGNLIINKYHVAKKKWERLQSNLIDGESQRNAYWQAFIDNNNIIHVSWVWRETWDVETNHDLCYAKSTDGGITWQKSTGEIYQLPISASTAEIAWHIPVKSELINQTSMHADKESNPFIVSYWRAESADVPQYHLVYNINGCWKRMKISDRSTNFSLSGGGTKKIPVSRPQLLVEESEHALHVYMIYRDSEHGNKICINYNKNIKEDKWFTSLVSDFPVNSWEPTYDSELWKERKALSIFVQNVGQGESETLEEMHSQPVYILDIMNIPEPIDSFSTENKH